MAEPAFSLQALGSNIWTVVGPNLVFAGAEMHTRMTIVRLSCGGYWVHSPIELNAQTRSVLTQLEGPVVALIAPNKLHHLYVRQWVEQYPEAQVFAEESLESKVDWFGRATVLTEVTPELYGQDIEQLIFGGNRLFTEAVFFHKPSRTLIFTDLMINLRLDGVRLLPSWFLRFEGVVYPNGGVARLYRWLTTDKAKARQAVEQILAWAPERITFCHGEPFVEDPVSLVRREFAWLLA